MTAAEQLFRLIDLIIQQTEFGNLSWAPTDEPFSYFVEIKDNRVFIESVDRDGVPPIQFSIVNDQGAISHSFITRSRVPEGPWDERVLTLWGMIADLNDPVLEMIRELDDYPPF